VRMENLVRVGGGEEQAYVLNLLGGVAGQVALARWVGVGLRAWASYGFAKEGREEQALANVEPQVLFHVGPLEPRVGVLLPVYPLGAVASRTTPSGDPIYDPRFVAVRLAITARF